jgi:uncharacterized repeat protein (TIGR01451 family)
MTVRLVTALGLFAFSSTAFAAADLVPTISGPTTAVYVGQTGRYTVKVSNTGNANTTNGSVVIDLPETNTSPTVYVMGAVVAKSSVCSQSGTTLTCNIGGIRRGKNVSVFVDLQLPESADPLVIDARVSTTNSENSTANNSASHTANPLNYSVTAMGASANIHNSHCTGTGLAAYYECTLFPSSLSTHDVVFNSDGSISIPAAGPDYSGQWTLNSSKDTLSFYYTELGIVVAEFEGQGISSTCWDGLTTFPGSTYVSPYRVCVQ